MGDKAEQMMSHIMAIKYINSGRVKGQGGYHDGYKRNPRVWVWHPDEIQQESNCCSSCPHAHHV